MALEGAEVIGVEPAKELIHQALAIDRERGLHIKYINSTAELMDLTLKRFDAVTALRSWHWFDRPIVNQRVMDTLKKDGHFIVVHSIFLPQLSKIAQETIRIIKEHISELKPAGAMGEVKQRRSGFPVNWFDEWSAAGFKFVDEWEHEYKLDFTKNEWCGKVRSLSWLTNESDAVKEIIIQKIQQSLIDHPEPLSIPHKYSVVLLKK